MRGTSGGRDSATARDVCVSGNKFVHYEEGSSKLIVSPDILVAFGLERRKLRTY